MTSIERDLKEGPVGQHGRDSHAYHGDQNGDRWSKQGQRSGKGPLSTRTFKWCAIRRGYRYASSMKIAKPSDRKRSPNETAIVEQLDAMSPGTWSTTASPFGSDWPVSPKKSTTVPTSTVAWSSSPSQSGTLAQHPTTGRGRSDWHTVAGSVLESRSRPSTASSPLASSSTQGSLILPQTHTIISPILGPEPL